MARTFKKCQQCGKSFRIYPSGAHRKYCSKDCHNVAQTTAERREITCKRCGRVFTAKQDHGNWPVYCSRECFEGDAPQPAGKECPSCGALFIAERSSRATADGLRIFCSVKCRHAGALTGSMRVCVNCGVEFYLRNSAGKQRPVNPCCSVQCQSEYYVLEKSHSWKGGKYVDSGSGQVRQLCKREDVVSNYLAEHRVIAAKYIGRFLERSEMMLHLNGIQDDNRPENLFICASIGEMRKRYNGSLPWPSESNLTTYGRE